MPHVVFRPEAAICVALFCALLALFPLTSQGADAGPVRIGVVDLHVDLPYQVNYKSRAIDRGKGRYVAEWLRAAGVHAVLMPLYVPRNVSKHGPRMVDLESSYRAMNLGLKQTSPYRLGLCAGGDSVGVEFAFEGAAPLGLELTSVARFKGLGVRVFGLIHSYDNELGSSSGYGLGQRPYGLTRRGKELVRRVHAVGGMIDISHMSDQAVADVFKQAFAADRPVVATHSNARAVARHPRNLTDQQLRSVARTGGVVGINFHSRFLRGDATQAEMADVVRHIRHVARVAGIDHVAIGSDFEGGIRPPKELSDVRGFPRLARALMASGFSTNSVQKIMAKNALRVLCAAPAQR